MDWLEKVKAKNWDGKSVYKYGQIKLDGNYTTLVIDGNGNPRMFSSKPIEITSNVLYTDFWNKIDAKCSTLRNSVVLGELYVPFQSASYVSTALSKKLSNMHWSAFAIKAWQGATISSFGVTNIASILRDQGFEVPPTRKIRNVEDRDAFIEYAKEMHYEGIVWKMANLIDWRKFKFQYTADCFITDVKWGKDALFGLIGSLEVSVYTWIEGKRRVIEVANVSGLTMAERYHYTELYRSGRDNLLGKVIEVTYQDFDARMRFPRFKRERNDKSPEECTMEQFDYVRNRVPNSHLPKNVEIDK